jgi:hypothetical protein
MRGRWQQILLFTLLLALYASLRSSRPLLKAVYLISTSVNCIGSGDSLNWASALPQWQHQQHQQHMRPHAPGQSSGV